MKSYQNIRITGNCKHPIAIASIIKNRIHRKKFRPYNNLCLIINEEHRVDAEFVSVEKSNPFYGFNTKTTTEFAIDVLNENGVLPSAIDSLCNEQEQNWYGKALDKKLLNHHALVQNCLPFIGDTPTTSYISLLWKVRLLMTWS